MPSILLSDATQERLERLFPLAQHSAARKILLDANRGYEEAFGSATDNVAMERFHIAALKISRGDLEKLRLAADLMQIDYRDLLVGAGFANDVKAHLKWMPGAR